MKKTPKHPHMKYNTYVVLRTFLEEQKTKAHAEYCIAANLTHGQKYDDNSYPPKFDRDGKSLPETVRNFIWENYRKQVNYYNDMLEQLRYAAEVSNSTHPNPEIRAFWTPET